MHVRMRIGFVGGGMRKTRDRREWKCEWALQGGDEKDRQLGMGMSFAVRTEWE
jgi:hypothetical protein